MSNISVVIVDDEPLAREGVRELLRGETDVKIVGECSDGIEAIEEIERLKPDLAFLDVQMPEMNGFEVLESLDPGCLPAVVFVTAYDTYALNAFNVHAVDYLLKPLDPGRFKQALDHARQRIVEKHGAQANRDIRALIETLKRRHRFVARFIVRSLGKLVVVKVADIDWIEAEGDYARLHVREKKYLIRETMHTLERKLDPEVFLRIHRSTIVNVERVRELQPLAHGEYMLILHNGAHLSSSRSYHNNLGRFLNYSS